MIEELTDKLIAAASEDGGRGLFTGDGIDAYRDIIEEAFAAADMKDQLLFAGEGRGRGEAPLRPVIP